MISAYDFINAGLPNWGSSACSFVKMLLIGGGRWGGTDDLGLQVWAGVQKVLNNNGGVTVFVSSFLDSVQAKFYKLTGNNDARYASEIGIRMLDRLQAVDSGYIYDGNQHCHTSLSRAMDRSSSSDRGHFMTFLNALFDSKQSIPPPFTCTACTTDQAEGCDGVIGSAALMDNCGVCRESDSEKSTCFTEVPLWIRDMCLA